MNIMFLKVTYPTLFVCACRYTWKARLSGRYTS